jgi:hypothetical protein
MMSLTLPRREILLIDHPMKLRRARSLSRYARLPRRSTSPLSDHCLCTDRIRRQTTLPRYHTPVRGSSHKGRETGMGPTAVGSAGMRSSPCRLHNAQGALINIPGSLRWMMREMPENQDFYVAHTPGPPSSPWLMIIKN